MGEGLVRVYLLGFMSLGLGLRVSHFEFKIQGVGFILLRFLI